MKFKSFSGLLQEISQETEKERKKERKDGKEI
jgi:hypothetical protein